MTKDEAIQQALVALGEFGYHGSSPRWERAVNDLRTALEQPEQEPDRRALQAEGTHPAPCARHCEAKAFEIEIRGLKSALKQAQQVQEPVACRFCHSKKGSWTWQCYKCGEIDDVQQPALPLPVQEPVGYVKGTYAGRLIYDTINPAVCLPVGMALYTAPLPVQEPTPWRDMVVVSLVREGINKHKARVLADHFAAQLVQEPVGEVVEVNNDGFRCEFSQHLPVGAKLYIAPPPPVQEPWGACVSGRVFVGALPEHVRKLTENDKLPIQLLYTAPPQRPWVGLTEEEIEVIGDKIANEDLVGLVSNFRGRLAKAIEQTLKERNT